MGGCYQIIIMDVEIVNGHCGQVQLKRLPVVTVVKREEHAGFCPGKQQAFAAGIFTH